MGLEVAVANVCVGRCCGDLLGWPLLWRSFGVAVAVSILWWGRSVVARGVCVCLRERWTLED